VIAFFQLRKTVHAWETDGLPVSRGGNAESDLELPVGGFAMGRRGGYYKK
jgi:hypothetical protein